MLFVKIIGNNIEFSKPSGDTYSLGNTCGGNSNSNSYGNRGRLIVTLGVLGTNHIE